MAAGTNPTDRDAAEPLRAPALFLLDRSGRVTGWTQAAERDSGYPAAELRGASLQPMFKPDPAQPGIAACLRTAGRRGQCGSRGRFARKDGSRFAASLAVERIRAQAGEPDRFAVSIADNPEDRLGVDALAASERQFRMLVQG